MLSAWRMTTERIHAGVAVGTRPSRQSRQHLDAAMPRQRVRRRRGHSQQQSYCAVRTAAPGLCWMSGSRPSSNWRSVNPALDGLPVRPLCSASHALARTMCTLAIC